MKNLIAKVKTADYKQLAVNHGEKAGAVLAGLAVLGAFWMTSWQTYARAPDELRTLADAKEQRIDASVWPDAERGQHQPKDFVNEAQKLLVGMKGAKFAYRVPMVFPLNPPFKHAQESGYLAVRVVIADYGLFIMQVRPEPVFGEEDLSEEATDEPRSGRLDNASRTASGQGADATLDGAAASGATALGNFGNFGLEGVDGAEGEETEQRSWIQARGERYVAVRGLVPLWEQAQKLVSAMGQAMGVETVIDMVDWIEFHDFTVHRQRAVAGADRWSGPWEELDIEVALEVLAEAADYSDDIIDPSVTNPTLTMPLPARGFGYWKKHATHPALEAFQLTKEQQEANRRFNKFILEEADKEGISDGGSTSGGFGNVTFDIRRIRDEVFKKKGGDKAFQQRFQDQDLSGMGGMGGMAAAMAGMDMPSVSQGISGIEGMSSAMQGMPGMQGMSGMQGGGANRAGGPLAASGHVILFRYFDFTVEPGQAYRYRVRIDYKNLARRLDPTRVANPTVLNGEFRPSDWSEPSEPVVIPADTKMFVKRVRPGRDVTFELFQWDAEMGTLINAELNCIHGQYVGGKQRAMRLNVAKPSLQMEQNVRFSSSDVLVDSSTPPVIDLSEHPELAAAFRDDRKAQRGDIGIPFEAIVVTPDGELVLLDSKSGLSDRRKEKAKVEAERKPFDDLEGDDEVEGESDLPDGYGAMMSSSAGMGLGKANPLRKPGKKKRRRSSRRSGGDKSRK